jgi:hypothetical protein
MLGFAYDTAIARWDRATPGTVFEFGVASGTTYTWMAQQIHARQLPITLVGFDSFQGLPEEAEGVWKPPVHQAGVFAYGAEHVERRLHDAGLAGDPRFKLISGFYSESLVSEGALAVRAAVKNLLLVSVDCDLYISTAQLLAYVRPILRVGTLLHFDDWKSPEFDHIEEPWGEHRAWAEFLAANPSLRAETLRVGQMRDRCLRVTAV